MKTILGLHKGGAWFNGASAVQIDKGLLLEEKDNLTHYDMTAYAWIRSKQINPWHKHILSQNHDSTRRAIA